MTDATASLAAARDVERALSAATSMTLLPALSDVREQVAGLVFPGFISRTGAAQLRHLPRYLRAIVARLEKLPTAVAQDRVAQNEALAATAKYIAARGTLPLTPDASTTLIRVRWLLEEFRVSLFAQHLRTAEPVSIQRIQKALDAG